MSNFFIHTFFFEKKKVGKEKAVKDRQPAIEATEQIIARAVSTFFEKKKVSKEKLEVAEKKTSFLLRRRQVPVANLAEKLYR